MTTIQKWGNSLAVRIPQAIAGQLNVSEGSEVEFLIRDGELVLRPFAAPKLSLKELLKNCKTSQLHVESDFGTDVGREVVD